MLKIRKKLAEKKEASKGIAKAGFTLIELLVVIAILAILVLLAAPRFLGYTKDAAVATMQADAKVLANSALIYNIDNEGWPTDGEATEETVAGETVSVKKFAEDKVEKHVQTLKGDLGDYALVTVGDDKLQEGDVIHLEGVENKEGVRHFGVNLSDAAPVVEDGE